MNSLSPELVSHIITFLPPSGICSLRHYATISRPFQFAIERHTFSRVILKSSDLSQFSHTFSPPHRRASLSSLEYRVLLPTYSHTRRYKFESLAEKTANNAAFTSALSDLFSLLASWGTSGHSITLQIGAYSPSDPKRLGLTRCPQEYRYCDSSLSLLSELQPVGRITTFKVFSSRNIPGTTVAGIAKNFPALTHVLWAIADDERKFPEVRLQQRNDFAAALDIPDSLINFRLKMESYQLVNHSFPVPRLVPDILAGALSRCLKGVVNIKLNGPIIVDAAIWDGYWPVLEFFHISLSTQTVDGGWWYDGTPPIYDISDDDDDDDDDTYWGDSVYSLDSGSSEVTDDYDVRLEKRLRGASPYPKFRTRIVPEFCGWLVAMAKGVKRMERVKKCEVVMNMFRPGSIEVYYYGEKVEGRVRRAWEVYVECEAEWKMCEELRNEWESMVGKEGVKEDSNRWQELYDLFD